MSPESGRATKKIDQPGRSEDDDDNDDLPTNFLACTGWLLLLRFMRNDVTGMMKRLRRCRDKRDRCTERLGFHH